MSDCIFCKIANGEIPSNKVYEDEPFWLLTIWTRRHRCMFSLSPRSILLLQWR